MYHPDGSWYRKYSDGWIEQGGFTGIAITSPVVVTLPHAFSNTNYIITFGAYIDRYIRPAHNKMPLVNNYETTGKKTTTSFGFLNTGENVTGWAWYACGK